MSGVIQIYKYDIKATFKYLNIIAKFALAVSFAVALFGNLSTVADKGMPFRAPFFLAPIWLVPLIVYIKKIKPYPHTGDLLITLPFLLDTLGNIFGLFDTFEPFDDISHMLSWLFLIMAFHAFRFRNEKSNKDAILIGTGVGAIIIILWEIAEWAISVDGFYVLKGLHLSYRDTIGDLFLSLTGSFIGSIVGVKLFGVKT